MNHQATADTTQVAAGSKFLTFVLAGGTYGIPILVVREIIAMQPVTSLPRMPAAIEGVFNLRGKIIPVIDLRKSLRLTAADYDRSTCVIVLDVETADQATVNIGCIVNAVREVSNIKSSEIQDPPSIGGRTGADYILGLAKSEDSDHVVTLLDMGIVLTEFMSEVATFDATEMAR